MAPQALPPRGKMWESQQRRYPHFSVLGEFDMAYP